MGVDICVTTAIGVFVESTEERREIFEALWEDDDAAEALFVGGRKASAIDYTMNTCGVLFYLRAADTHTSACCGRWVGDGCDGAFFDGNQPLAERVAQIRQAMFDGALPPLRELLQAEDPAEFGRWTMVVVA